MQVYTNGYGETVRVWQIGDKAMYQSTKYPDLAPYAVTITGIYVEMDHGHPAYLMHEEGGWNLFDNYSPVVA